MTDESLNPDLTNSTGDQPAPVNEYLITYELKGKHRDDSQLQDVIHGLFPGAWHGLDSVWVVRTNMRAKTIRKLIREHLNEDDGIFVVRLGDDYSGRGYKPKFKKWRARGEEQ